MTAYAAADHPRSRRIVFIYTAAISVAFVSGTFALVALLVGSPRGFGTGLALCGAAWIIAHIAEQFAQHQRTRRSRHTLDSKRRCGPALSAPGYLHLGAPVQVGRHSPTRERVLSTV